MTNELFPRDFFAALQQVPLNNRYADYSNSAAARAAQQRSVNRREYQAGDSRHLVDWRASARSPQLMVRPQQDAHTRGLVLCLDRSLSFTAESDDRDYAQRRLALALGLRCLQNKAELSVVAGTQWCHLTSVAQGNELQGFLTELSEQPKAAIDLQVLPSGLRVDELVFLTSPWHSLESVNGAARFAKRLRALLLLSARECKLPQERMVLQHAATHEQLNVDWHSNPPQQRFTDFVEFQLRQLQQRGFSCSSFAVPSPVPAAELIELSHEFLLH